MSNIKEQAIELIQDIPDDKVVHIIDILKGLKGLADSDKPQRHFDGQPTAMGIFGKYANPDLIQQETDAWSKAVKEKHANN